jgi:8-oxo-dGTP pyrophosphatase MutT (NUDIX family)
MWRHRFVSDIWNWELPGGLVDDGEDPAETIARELVEETGYRAGSLEGLITFQPMIGMVDSPHHLFRASDLALAGEPTERTEMARMRWVSIPDVKQLIRKGEIQNSGSLIALLYIMALMDQN